VLPILAKKCISYFVALASQAMAARREIYKLQTGFSKAHEPSDHTNVITIIY